MNASDTSPNEVAVVRDRQRAECGIEVKRLNVLNDVAALRRVPHVADGGRSLELAEEIRRERVRHEPE